MKYLKQYWVAVLVLVLIIIVFVYSSRHQAPQTAQSSNQTQDQMAPETTASPTPTPTSMMMQTQTWTGTLMSSNDLSKGNLMLQTTGHTVYINTSKDYSPLFNKQVTVSYKGSLDSFTLEGITAN